jgi:Aerotolerance regulator N-terminal
MFQGFVHPALAFGAALAAVPLIIHLLNRQRYQPMEWAAMRFVLAAYKKTRRRVQLENLLLLLLRMGAVALLALAIARPYASGDGAFAPLTERRTDLVLVVDASASTGYREDIETVFERIVGRAGEVISDLDGGRGDRIQLIVAGSRARLFGWQSPDKALSLLTTLTEPTDEALDLTAVLGEVLSLAQEDAAGSGRSSLEVRLLSDLQRNNFARTLDAQSPSGEQEGRALLDQELDALEAIGVRVTVEDLGPTATVPANLGVADVAAAEGGPATAGAPVEIAVRLANHGPSPRPAARVSLSVDGNKLPVQRVNVPAGGTAEAVFSVVFDEPGPHTLVAELDGDHLACDDRRATVLLVPPPIRVLVVNGSPSDELEEDEVGYLMMALEPLRRDADSLARELSPFEADEVTLDVLVDPELDLRAWDVIILAGLAAVPERAIEALERRVAGGAALVIAMGPRLADLTTTNERLYRPDGSGLLPAELVRRVSVARRESYYRVADFDGDHPALSFFNDEAWKPFLTEVPLYSFVQARPLPDARVLASLDDEGRSPLLIERAYDQGRVYLLTTSFNPDWSDLVRLPQALIPLVHEWLRYAGSRPQPARVLRPGEPLSLVVDTFPRMAELRRADGSRRSLDGEPQELPDGRWRLPEVGGNETERAGLYTIGLDGKLSEPFAVQLDRAESDLTRMSPGELASLHPALVLLERGEDAGSVSQDGSQRGEVWRWVAILCLAFLVGESLWGAWIGQRRRIA